jgi:ABC-type lipoprotein release transport system permease subunit
MINLKKNKNILIYKEPALFIIAPLIIAFLASKILPASKAIKCQIKDYLN